jgi:transposase
MSINYTKLRKRPVTFLRLFGVKPQQLDVIVQKVTPLWEKRVLGAYKRPGRDFKLSLEEMTLMVLLYYRSYTTQLHVGFLFGLDDSRVCRLMRRLEPILAEVMAIPKRKNLTEEDIAEILLDATEQTIERPKRGQKSFYSGKKKRHTVKTEIRVTPGGKIVHVSKTRPGSIHDFTVYKEGPPVLKDTRTYVDSGYQGLDKIHTQTELPYKKSKNAPLTREDKFYNRGLSRVRVKIEQIFGQLKVFKILSERYRNKRKRYNLKFNIIAGIVNLKNGFGIA